METEDVYISNKKPIYAYVNACNWVLNQGKTARILGRGNNVKIAVDVAEIVKRDLINPESYIITTSEKLVDEQSGNDRFVSVISIELSGTKKE